MAINAVGNRVVAGPVNSNNGGDDAALTLPGGTPHVSFLWGSPDAYNTLTSSATAITSLVVSSRNTNAFEIANVTAVPEPETYALMRAGLGALGFMARAQGRRQTMPSFFMASTISCTN